MEPLFYHYKSAAEFNEINNTNITSLDQIYWTIENYTANKTCEDLIKSALNEGFFEVFVRCLARLEPKNINKYNIDWSMVYNRFGVKLLLDIIDRYKIDLYQVIPDLDLNSIKDIIGNISNYSIDLFYNNYYNNLAFTIGNYVRYYSYNVFTDLLAKIPRDSYFYVYYVLGGINAGMSEDEFGKIEDNDILYLVMIEVLKSDVSTYSKVINKLIYLFPIIDILIINPDLFFQYATVELDSKLVANILDLGYPGLELIIKYRDRFTPDAIHDGIRLFVANTRMDSGYIYEVINRLLGYVTVDILTEIKNIDLEKYMLLLHKYERTSIIDDTILLRHIILNFPMLIGRLNSLNIDINKVNIWRFFDEIDYQTLKELKRFGYNFSDKLLHSVDLVKAGLKRMLLEKYNPEILDIIDFILDISADLGIYISLDLNMAEISRIKKLYGRLSESILNKLGIK